MAVGVTVAVGVFVAVVEPERDAVKVDVGVPLAVGVQVEETVDNGVLGGVCVGVGL